MGQLLPGIDQTKTHLERKNSTVFRNFVMDKIYAIEENKAKEKLRLANKDDEKINSLKARTR